MKYSDQLAIWLLEEGYTHCFYVTGGNIMHLVESLNQKLDCRPTIHEVAAGIAAEYFNETSDNGKAFALVTAGPGITNITTAIAGAYLESRELLVIGGQVKTEDLSYGQLRQKGIQEISGVDIVKPICKRSKIVLDAWDKEKLFSEINYSSSGRKGPVFLEIPIDVQAQNVFFEKKIISTNNLLPIVDDVIIDQIVRDVKASSSPVILLGGGIDRKTADKVHKLFSKTTIPVMTSYNGADRLSSNHPNYAGRPNTWGQRSSNILIQQADILLALGTRLGLQQTGFNWKKFIPNGKIIQIDIDKSELEKENPEITQGLAVDANDFLIRLLNNNLGNHDKWLKYCQQVRRKIPIVEEGINEIDEIYVSPHEMVRKLSNITKESDVIIPCSSGGAFTMTMQVFEQKYGQKLVTNKSLASMGYGLSGAIGASIANPNKRIILIEGDGGFAQNIQEIGTAAINNCNIKVFILDDCGYASIRMTQKTYFKGNYVGCDLETGLGLPKWEVLFKAWDVDVTIITPEVFNSSSYMKKFENEGFQVFVVRVDPEQTYYPKITSRINSLGKMESNPINIMTPEFIENIENFSDFHK
jgi:acetolactate synthase I/II/III large subunit